MGITEGPKKKAKTMGAVLKEIQTKLSKDNPDILFDPTKKYEVVPSGDLNFDLVTGIGGFPKGRITEICAFESTGKTSLLLATIGAAQRRGEVCVLFDHEQCFDPWYAESCYGLKVDQESFILLQPMTIEEEDIAFDLLMETDVKFSLIAWDSIACMIPQAMAEASLEDNATIGLHARYITRLMHKVKTAAYLRNFAAVFTNQFKFQIQKDQFTQGIGVATGKKWKDPYTTPGGVAPRFMASIRMTMELAASSQEKTEVKDPISGEKSEEITTRRIKVVNIKNKCSRPELKGISYFDLVTPIQKGGWNSNREILEILKKRGHIVQNGAMFKYIGLEIPEWTCRGKANGEKEFMETPTLINDAYKLFNKLREEDTNKDLLLDKAVLGEDISEQARREQRLDFSEVNLSDLPEPPEKELSTSGDITL